ncbi:reverse transcriptase [Phytophthora megakarya]|uniref:Reverse transcriptase n=1 Tax=Phytophthora megakarya TaxID=4795 RepID=A0A225WK45_9STRA|nr:reverse transcriptase [Phytophthora megakarya]
MSERAKLTSAFVCPFGHFQWTRMSFGLKNAPLIYQSVINNCLWGFVRLPPEEGSRVDQNVLDFLGLDPSDNQESESGRPQDEVKRLPDSMTVFQRNILMPSHIHPVLGRASLENRSIPYPSLEISAEGIRAIPKVAKGVMNLPFPKSHKGVQSFLGSLNYYHRLIEDFSRFFTNFRKIRYVRNEISHGLMNLLKCLKTKDRCESNVETSGHPNVICYHPAREPMGRLCRHSQEYDGKVQPVRCTRCVHNDAELRYHIAENEVIAILRDLQIFRTILEGRQLIIYTRYSVLKWVLQSKSAMGGAFLRVSHFHIGISKSGKVQMDEEGFVAIMGAGITPREYFDETLVPLKGHVRRQPVGSVENLGSDFQGVVLRRKTLHQEMKLWLCAMAVSRLECPESEEFPFGQRHCE